MLTKTNIKIGKITEILPVAWKVVKMAVLMVETLDGKMAELMAHVLEATSVELSALQMVALTAAMTDEKLAGE